MLSQEAGVLPGSDYYCFTPSTTARELFYYIASCGHFICDGNYYVDRENYGNFILAYVKAGKLYVETRGKPFVATEGALVFLDCHMPHKYYAKDFAEFVWVHFEGADSARFHAKVLAENAGRSVFFSGNGDLVARDIGQLVAAFRGGQTLHEAEYSGILYRILLALVADTRDYAVAGADSVISDAIAYINAHLGADLYVRDVAAAVNLSVYHFSRRFKKAVGASPYEYITVTRISQAKRLLKTTALTTREIGFSIGYNSESTFISTFSSRVGMPPQTFREFPF